MSELSNSNLPNDLVNDILLRLAIKPICRFRCVSKPWRSLLSNPQFLKTHHEHHIDHPRYLIVKPRSSSYPAYILTLAAAAENSSATNDAVARKLQPELKWHAVAGSCNGLLLLEHGSKLLVNPITLETVHIPDNRDLDLYGSPCFYGFGYDSSTDDYKIVSLSKTEYGGSTIVDVYSLRMKRWKRIANSPYTLGREPADGVFLNGRIHWYGYYNGNDAIVCFDLGRDEFVEGLVPDNVKEERFYYQVMVFNGCLALVSYFAESDSYNVWVMREYGVRDSWTKFTVICPENEGNHHYYYFVCELSEDEIVLEKDAEKLVAYNWRNGVFRDLVIAGLPASGFFGSVMPFEASLLSPII